MKPYRSLFIMKNAVDLLDRLDVIDLNTRIYAVAAILQMSTMWIDEEHEAIRKRSYELEKSKRLFETYDR